MTRILRYNGIHDHSSLDPERIIDTGVDRAGVSGISCRKLASRRKVARCLHVAGGLSFEGLTGCDGACLRSAAEFFVAPSANTRQFWKNSTEFQGSKVYQRNDLINSKLMDSRGRTNLQRMEKGLAPIYWS